MRASLVLRNWGAWGRYGKWAEKMAENQAKFYHGPYWGKYGNYWHYHYHRPKRMVLGFLAGVAVGYIACANYPPRWMNMEYVKERKCWQDMKKQWNDKESEFTTRVINPEFVRDYNPDSGVVTIKLPEAIRERFNQFASKREEFSHWTSKRDPPQ